MANLNIGVKVTNRGVRESLRGVTKEVKKTEDEQRKSSRRTADDTEKNERRKRKSVERTGSTVKRAERERFLESRRRAREILEDFRKTERKKREELARTLRETRMTEGQRARITARTERQIARGRRNALAESQGIRRGTAGRGQALLGAGVGTAAVLGGVALNTANRLAGAGGVRSQEELLQLQNEFNARLADLSARSEIDATRLREAINTAAISQGVDQFELLGRLEAQSTRFGSGAVQSGVENLNAIARAAQGARVEIDALATATDTSAEVFGLAAEEAEGLTNFIVDIGDRGAIDAGELASEFAPFLGEFQRGTGRRGQAAAEDALRISALLGRGFTSAAEAKTMGSSLLRSLGDVGTQERLALATGARVRGRGRNRRVEGGMRITEDGTLGGRVTDPLEAVRAIMGDAQLNRGQLQEIFGRAEAFNAADILFNESNTEAGRSILGATAEGGRGIVERGITAQEQINRGGRDLDRARAQAFATFQANSDAYSRSVVTATRSVGEFTAAHPGAIEALTSLKEAAVGLAAVFTALKLAGAGAAVGSLGGATGAARAAAGVLSGGAGMGATVGAAGGGAAAATAGVGLAAGLGIGAGLTALVNPRALSDTIEALGRGSLLSELSGGFSAPTRATSSAEALAAARRRREASGATADPANTQATERNTRAMEGLTRAISSTGSGAGADTGGAPPAGVQ